MKMYNKTKEQTWVYGVKEKHFYFVNVLPLQSATESNHVLIKGSNTGMRGDV